MNNYWTKAKRNLALYLPNKDKIQQHPSLRWLHQYLHNEALWQLNARSVPRAMFIGLFVSCLPMPLQMLLAAVLAIITRANLLIATALCWVSNPLTMAPLFYAFYHLGRWLLKRPPLPLDDLSFTALLHQVQGIFIPLLVGALVAGATVGSLGYVIAKCCFILAAKRRGQA